SIRTVGPVTTAADGYLTIGAGNRADVPAGAVTATAIDAERLRERAESLLYGAEPDALAEALVAQGRRVAVVGTTVLPQLAALHPLGSVKATITTTDRLGA